MATAGSRVVVGWAWLAALLALLAVAGASTLTVFDGPGCSGNVAVQSCGSCQDISNWQKGGYYFLSTGGYAYFYNSADCADASPAAILTEDAWHCDNFDYNSVFIPCSSSAGGWDITATQQ